MATATYTNEQGEVLPRYVNTDFPHHPSWSDLGLVVLVDHPGYSTTKSSGLRHWVAADFGGLGHKLPAVGSWLPASKTPPGKFLTVALAPAGWGPWTPRCMAVPAAKPGARSWEAMSECSILSGF